MLTLWDMVAQSAVEHSDKIAVIGDGSCLSYRDLETQTRSVAGALLRLGLQKGDRVAVVLEKTPEAVVSFLGIIAAGGVMYPMDPGTRPEVAAQTARHVNPSLVIAAERFLPWLSSFCPLPPSACVVVGAARRTPAGHLWEEAASGAPLSRSDIHLAATDPAYLNFSSGSTGTPKAVLATHANIYWNTVAVVKALELTAADVHLCMFPPFLHPHEMLARPLYLGGAMVLLKSVSPRAILQAIGDHAVTCMHATASVYGAMARFQSRQAAEHRSFRLAESGGMTPPPGVPERFEEAFGIPLTPVWGSAETTGVAIACSPRRDAPKEGIGRPCPHYEVKVMDDTGHEADVEQVGEMWIRGLAVAAPYPMAGSARQEIGGDGWLHTGDLAKRDRHGHLYLVGRKSRVIKVAGVQVMLPEIERVLREHPAVADVAVVRCRHSTHGEVPKALVVMQPGKRANAADLQRFCADRLAPLMVPRVVTFVDSLPRTAGGKIAYGELDESS